MFAKFSIKCDQAFKAFYRRKNTLNKRTAGRKRTKNLAKVVIRKWFAKTVRLVTNVSRKNSVTLRIFKLYNLFPLLLFLSLEKSQNSR